jgi:hypothetical protein
MQLIEHPDGTLETCHVPRGLPLALALFGVAALALALTGALWWYAGPAALLAMLGTAALWEAWNQRLPSRFRFEPDARVLRWRVPGRFGTGLVRGECGFERVRQVVLQAGPGRGPGRVRIALLLHAGPPPASLQLSRDFSLTRAQAAPIAAQLRALLGLESADRLHARVLQEARRAGEDAAVALLRREAGLSERQARELTGHLVASDGDRP